MHEVRNLYDIIVMKAEAVHHLSDLGVDEGITLKCIFKGSGMRE
jgi:hypothetical protein